MRRVLLILTVAALMAAMMVSAGPAQADVSFGGSDVSFGGGSGISFGGDDDDGGITSDILFVQVDSTLGDFDPGGVSIFT